MLLGGDDVVVQGPLVVLLVVEGSDPGGSFRKLGVVCF